MLASLTIVFREVLEAGLIIGIVLSATEGVAGRMRWIIYGLLSGIAGSGLVAGFAGVISGALDGIGQEVFNAGILAIAVCMLGWHNIWMAKHGRELAREMTEVGRSVARGERSLAAMAVVVAIAVLREGSEIVLFLYGILASAEETQYNVAFGGFLGIGLGAAISYLLYRGLLSIPMRHLFTVTNWLIALLAAGMAATCVQILSDADILPSLGNKIWDTSSILSQTDILGKAMHAMVGYSDRPSGIQLLAYGTTLLVLVVVGRLVNGAPKHRPTSVASPAE